MSVISTAVLSHSSSTGSITLVSALRSGAAPSRRNSPPPCPPCADAPLRGSRSRRGAVRLCASFRAVAQLHRRLGPCPP